MASLLAPTSAGAYPPSPYHLIYGLVRDEYGTPLMNNQVKILLVSTGGSQTQTAIDPGLAVGLNYQLPVPMDTLLKPDLYRPNALVVGTAIRVYVVVGNTTNIPIVSATISTNLGQPTKMTRIDLTLGTDSNGDGIPDEWELAYLAALGSNLTLSNLNATLDLAHNGLTLIQEFQLGTAAFDSSNPFSVRIVGYNAGSPILEFPTTAGVSYSVLGSTNLQQWGLLPFRLAAEDISAPARTSYTETVVQTLQVKVAQSGPVPPALFFRISSH
jgi:hypothetical protein